MRVLDQEITKVFKKEFDDLYVTLKKCKELSEGLVMLTKVYSKDDTTDYSDLPDLEEVIQN